MIFDSNETLQFVFIHVALCRVYKDSDKDKTLTLPLCAYVRKENKVGHL